MYGMLSVTIIPTRKCYPKYADTTKRTLNLLKLQITPPTKTYPPESHTHARTETDLEKNTWKNKIPAHKNRPITWTNSYPLETDSAQNRPDRNITC